MIYRGQSKTVLFWFSFLWPNLGSKLPKMQFANERDGLWHKPLHPCDLSDKRNYQKILPKAHPSFAFFAVRLTPTSNIEKFSLKCSQTKAFSSPTITSISNHKSIKS